MQLPSTTGRKYFRECFKIIQLIVFTKKTKKIPGDLFWEEPSDEETPEEVCKKLIKKQKVCHFFDSSIDRPNLILLTSNTTKKMQIWLMKKKDSGVRKTNTSI